MLDFNAIHIVLVGPLPPSQGYTYLLTCVDRFTRWPEAFPLVDITADSVARAFVQGWISCFGVPSTITTDRGRQFESNLWSSFMQLLGATRLRTTAYHPAANGMVERLHRQLKAALKCHALPLVLLGIRTALKEDLKCTAAEMVYGTTLRLPGEFFNTAGNHATANPADYVARLKANMQQLHAPPVRENNPSGRVFQSQAFSSCTHVFVRHDATRKPLQPVYDGPFKIIERQDKYFVLDLNGRTDTVCIDGLKPIPLVPLPSRNNHHSHPTLPQLESLVQDDRFVSEIALTCDHSFMPFTGGRVMWCTLFMHPLPLHLILCLYSQQPLPITQ